MNEEELFCKLFPDYVVNGKPLSPYFDLFESGFEQAENRIEELEQKISVLLSCKNCPENNGGYICQKEYENKCLAQKIQYINELQEEVAELKGIKDVATLIRANNDTVTTLMQLNNKLVSKSQQLTKAKELIKKFSEFVNNENEYDPEHPQEHTDLWNKLCEEAEQFLSEVEK